MDTMHFAGALLRIFRLEHNWSQETLCRGICTVSYLSKIEQGKVQPNEILLTDLFEKMGISWRGTPSAQSTEYCENLYETVFAEETLPEESVEMLFPKAEKTFIDANYLDYLVLESWLRKEPARIHTALHKLLSARQQCLVYLLEGKPVLALQTYPCAIAAKCAGANAYACGKYVSALEYLQRGYDLACQEGQVRLMMYCQIYMANCHSDLRNFPKMLDHYKIARRLARTLGENDIIRTIAYNIASTQYDQRCRKYFCIICGIPGGGLGLSNCYDSDWNLMRCRVLADHLEKQSICKFCI